MYNKNKYNMIALKVLNTLSIHLNCSLETASSWIMVCIDHG